MKTDAKGAIERETRRLVIRRVRFPSYCRVQ
jgi:hypothetical protein